MSLADMSRAHSVCPDKSASVRSGGLRRTGRCGSVHLPGLQRPWSPGGRERRTSGRAWLQAPWRQALRLRPLRLRPLRWCGLRPCPQATQCLTLCQVPLYARGADHGPQLIPASLRRPVPDLAARRGERTWEGAGGQQEQPGRRPGCSSFDCARLVTYCEGMTKRTVATRAAAELPCPWAGESGVRLGRIITLENAVTSSQWELASLYAAECSDKTQRAVAKLVN